MKTSRIVGSMITASVTVAALTGGAVALADQDDAGTTSQESRQGPGPGGYGPGAHGPNKLGQMLHGESVVELEDGTYVTQRMQVGDVTSVSETSLTVRSEDGFTETYVVGEETTLVRDQATGTAASVGDVAHVRAIVTGTTITADVVMALSPAQAALRDERHDGDEKMHGRSLSRA
ncbi:MAG: hypothetical protein WEA35_06935 [Candidatus Nanopelagicales bacterium]